MKYKPLPGTAKVDLPGGVQLIVAYAKDEQVLIPLNPEELDKDHDCDWEGCGEESHALTISPRQKYDMRRAACPIGRSEHLSKEVARLIRLHYSTGRQFTAEAVINELRKLVGE